MASRNRKRQQKSIAKNSPAGDPVWQKFVREHHVAEGSFVRGTDCSGNPCAGVVWYSILSCHHLEIRTTGGEGKKLHVNRADMTVIADQDLSPAELAFALEERAKLGALSRFYELTGGMRCCPAAFQVLMEALESSTAK